MSLDFELLTGDALHQRVIQDMVLNARRTVWIATANLKDMHIKTPLGFKPVLEHFDRMADRNVSFRIVHADMPSRPFRNTLEKQRSLLSGKLELQICPRSHWKMVVVDGETGYMGSANFTGAGLGAKQAARRNLELGVVSRNREFVSRLSRLFDRFWIGDDCVECAFRDECPDPIR